MTAWSNPEQPEPQGPLRPHVPGPGGPRPLRRPRYLMVAGQPRRAGQPPSLAELPDTTGARTREPEPEPESRTMTPTRT